MKLLKFLVLSLFFLAAVQCSSKQPVEAADLVLINGNIVTVDESNPRAEALAVKGDTIVAVGSNKDIKTYIDKKETEIIDLQGKLALPGFNDGHVHFVYGGHASMSISLDGVTSPDEIQRRVQEKIEEKNEGEWISGRGWDQEILPGKKWPTK
ncbi:MAG: amidohydrolase family protein, partial [Candidatus Aminicenantes bacterium]|nr:amidohydrolase family protein [Candidatus Aminicenantes bacterium]